MGCDQVRGILERVVVWVSHLQPAAVDEKEDGKAGAGRCAGRDPDVEEETVFAVGAICRYRWAGLDIHGVIAWLGADVAKVHVVTGVIVITEALGKRARLCGQSSVLAAVPAPFTLLTPPSACANRRQRIRHARVAVGLWLAECCVHGGRPPDLTMAGDGDNGRVWPWLD